MFFFGHKANKICVIAALRAVSLTVRKVIHLFWNIIITEWLVIADSDN